MRVDLPDVEQGWGIPLTRSGGVHGLFLIDSWIYAFNVGQNVYQYSSLDGTLVATATLGATPFLGMCLFKIG